MTAIAPIPSLNQSHHLTSEQKSELRSLVFKQLQTHRDRVVQTAAALEDFASTDSPSDREAAREQLQKWLTGLSEFEDALARLDAGTYGSCNSCANPIPFERLEALPEVDHCVDCVSHG